MDSMNFLKMRALHTHEKSGVRRMIGDIVRRGHRLDPSRRYDLETAGRAVLEGCSLPYCEACSLPYYDGG